MLKKGEDNFVCCVEPINFDSKKKKLFFVRSKMHYSKSFAVIRYEKNAAVDSARSIQIEFIPMQIKAFIS